MGERGYILASKPQFPNSFIYQNENNMKIALSAKLVIVYFKQINAILYLTFPKISIFFALDKQASYDYIIITITFSKESIGL